MKEIYRNLNYEVVKHIFIQQKRSLQNNNLKLIQKSNLEGKQMKEEEEDKE